jgi:hypothetical protein
VRYSSSGGWAKLCNPPLPIDVACGDMNGDGRDDLIGSWPSGTFYRDSIGGSWTYVTSQADVLAAGDIDGDGIDDLIGVWSTGLWAKFSSTNSWKRLDWHIPTDISCGDVSGDGRDDVIGTWSAYGTYYRDSSTASWVYVATPAELLAAGDIDGDGVDDLIGTWSGAYIGLWVKYSATMSWKKLVRDLPTDIDAGLYRDGAWDAAAIKNVRGPAVGYAAGPDSIADYIDFSESGPGGGNFVYRSATNLVPQMSEAEEQTRVRGPGETGFTYRKQENLIPKESFKKKE